MRTLLSSLVVLCIVAMSSPGAAEPAQVYAAGSLSTVVPLLIKSSGLDASSFAAPTFGPSGGLRERIEKGEPVDLFLSADTEHPRTLAKAKPQTLVIPFARNNLCLFARSSLGLTQSNALDKMLDPSVRLATSTPVLDPGGDYAFAAFKRAEAVHPGAEAMLAQKALKLFVGPTAMTPMPGHSLAGSILLADKADLLLVYCSGKEQTARDVPDLSVVRLPPAIDVAATYGLALLSNNPVAERLALFVLSDKGQAILAANGLVPVDGESRR
jgi:ABC-type molybdate transport system substrate-binding protein